MPRARRRVACRTGLARHGEHGGELHDDLTGLDASRHVRRRALPGQLTSKLITVHVRSRTPARRRRRPGGGRPGRGGVTAAGRERGDGVRRPRRHNQGSSLLPEAAARAIAATSASRRDWPQSGIRGCAPPVADQPATGRLNPAIHSFAFTLLTQHGRNRPPSSADTSRSAHALRGRTASVPGEINNARAPGHRGRAPLPPKGGLAEVWSTRQGCVDPRWRDVSSPLVWANTAGNRSGVDLAAACVARDVPASGEEVALLEPGAPRSSLQPAAEESPRGSPTAVFGDERYAQPADRRHTRDPPAPVSLQLVVVTDGRL